METKEGTIIPANDITPEAEGTPTTEQQMTTLQSQLKELSARAEKAERSEQGLRGSLQEKDRKLKETAEIKDEVQELKDMIKILATQRVGMDEDDLHVTPDKKSSAEAIWNDLEAKREKKRQDATLKAQQDDYSSQAIAIHNEAIELFGDDVDKLFKIRQYLDAGYKDLAEGMVTKARKKEPEVKETAEELKKKYLEEGRRLALEESGALSTSTTLPSGLTESDSVFLKKFASGDLPVKQENVDRYNKIKNTY